MKAAGKIVGLCLVVLLATDAFSAPPLADKLPEQTLFYLGWAGRTLTFDGSMLGQLLKEPEIGQLAVGLKKLLLATQAGNRDAQEAIDHAWAMASIAWQHPVAMGLFDLRLPAGPGAPPMPVGALLVDLGKDRPAFDDHVQKLLNLAGENLRVTQATVGNVSYQTFPTPLGPAALGFVGDTFFASVGEKAPETIVALAGGKASPLSAGAAFAAAMKEVAGDQVQTAYYVDVARAYQLAERLLAGGAVATAPAPPTQFQQAVKALGVSQITALVGAVNVVDRGMQEKVRLLSPGPHRGVLMFLAGKPLSAKALEGVPADADVVATINLDPAAALAEVKRVAGEISPQAGKELEHNLAMISEQLGLDIEKDLLAHVGDQWMLLSAPSLGGFITGTAVTVELKDAAKFSASLAKLEEFFGKMLGRGEQPGERPRRGVEFRSYKADKMEVHYLAMPGLPVPVAPSWAIANDRLYIAAFPQVVVAAATGASEKPLAAAPEFVALQKRVAASPSALAYVNTPALVRRLYGLPMGVFSLLSNMVAGQFGPVLPPELVPTLAKVEKYLLPDIATISSDARGITFESYGSGVGGEMLGASVNALSFWFMSKARLGSARTEARRALSRTNLRGIGTACEMYAVEHGDRLPADLPALIKEGFISAEMLMSPNSGRKPQRDAEGKLMGPFDYVYLGGHMPASTPADMVLAYERPEVNRFEGTCVLFRDTSVRWLTMPQFQQALKKTEDFLREKGKPGTQ